MIGRGLPIAEDDRFAIVWKFDAARKACPDRIGLLGFVAARPRASARRVRNDGFDIVACVIGQPPSPPTRSQLVDDVEAVWAAPDHQTIRVRCHDPSATVSQDDAGLGEECDEFMK